MLNGMANANEQFDLDLIKKQTAHVVESLLSAASLQSEDILVIGCSSSEIISHKIGTYSSVEVGDAVFSSAYDICKKHHIYIAAQCCEHLNRALIVEKECAVKYNLTRVNVIPVPKAGGSFSTAAYKRLTDAYTVKSLNHLAAAGIDVGDTLIGMHMRSVVVPVRIDNAAIGAAHIVCARTRPEFVGGERAVYDTSLL